jgi:hypothetical protein
MKGYQTLVHVTEGNEFYTTMNMPCAKCNAQINTSKGDKCLQIGCVMTREEFGGSEARISWTVVCEKCSHELADFFNTTLSYRGNIVYMPQNLKMATNSESGKEGVMG